MQVMTSDSSAGNTPGLFWQKAEFYRFVWIIAVMAFVAIFGGLAAAFAVRQSVFLLGLVVFPSGIALAMILSVMRMRVIFLTGAVAVLLDLIIIMYNLL